ncbi:MAG TPA: hypothetical protein VK927_01260 [Adhaeribacter sp.]|nr:hypothetical protein [Adhaeribacter sp.]
MKNNLVKLLPALFFIITGSLAGFYEKDYLEMLMWYSFAAATIIPFLPIKGVAPGVVKAVSVGFFLLGLVMLAFSVFSSF